MSISRLKTWNAGDVLTASDLNGEFNNIINNALALVSPLTGNLNVNNKQLTNMLLEVQTATQSSANVGRTYFQSSENCIHVDVGTLSGNIWGPGGIARVPVIQGLQGGDIPVASHFIPSGGLGATPGATTFVALRVASNFQVLRSGNSTPNIPAYVDMIAGSGIGLVHNAGNITITSAQTFSSVFVSATSAITVSSTLNVAHGLGALPKGFVVTIQNNLSEGGYSTGDEVELGSGPPGGPNSVTAGINATNVFIVTPSTLPQILNKASFGSFVITAANWAYRVRAWL